MKTTPIQLLTERLTELTYIGSALSVLYWDQSVNMPNKGSAPRSISVSHMSGIIHQKIIELDKDGVLTKLKKQLDGGRLKGKDAVIVEETWRFFSREIKLPEKFVRELSEVTSRAQHVWAEAKEKGDYHLFKPWLKKIIDLKRKEAEYVGYEDSPYDALLDAYEPGMTTVEAARILNDLKSFLVPFIQKIRDSKVQVDNTILRGDFPLPKQIAFNRELAEKLGFEFEAGRIDVSSHPFSIGFHPHDVRITTRYGEHDVFAAIGSTIHETGHALYEQGLPAEHYGTALGESVSLGIHESQSRIWEKNIGQSKDFWKFYYPKLRKAFPEPFGRIDLKTFYAAINKVWFSPIRTESDEVTYNLHIILRFEIEKEMIEGTIDLDDLPKIWNAKMKEYFGITIKNDRDGILQDVHWSNAGIGYFPTYTFGNLFAAQLFATMKKKVPDLSKKISSGDFKPIREWLRKNIHAHGKSYSSQGLIKKVTGEPLNSVHFQKYLTEKYSEIYKLK